MALAAFCACEGGARADDVATAESAATRQAAPTASDSTAARRSDDGAAPAAPTPRASAQALAEQALATYLAGEAYVSPTAAPDSVVWCPPPTLSSAESDESAEGWEPDTYIGVVRPRVLGLADAIHLHADTSDGIVRTARVSAEVVTVARFDRDGEGGWRGMLAPQTDTLIWSLHERTSGAWAVCGPAAPIAHPAAGGLFLVTDRWARGSVIADATWSPDGASWTTALRVADSLGSAP